LGIQEFTNNAGQFFQSNQQFILEIVGTLTQLAVGFSNQNTLNNQARQTLQSLRSRMPGPGTRR
jgi:hypothetical protein